MPWVVSYQVAPPFDGLYGAVMLDARSKQEAEQKAPAEARAQHNAVIGRIIRVEEQELPEGEPFLEEDDVVQDEETCPLCGDVMGVNWECATCSDMVCEDCITEDGLCSGCTTPDDN